MLMNLQNNPDHSLQLWIISAVDHLSYGSSQLWIISSVICLVNCSEFRTSLLYEGSFLPLSLVI